MARSFRKNPYNNEGRCRRHKPAKRAHRRAVNMVVSGLTQGEDSDAATFPCIKRVSGEFTSGTSYMGPRGGNISIDADEPMDMHGNPSTFGAHTAYILRKSW